MGRGLRREGGGEMQGTQLGQSTETERGRERQMGKGWGTQTERVVESGEGVLRRF